MRGGVAPAGVALADLADILGPPAEERIDQRRLSHARHPDQCQRLPSANPGLKPLDAKTSLAAGQHDRDAREERAENVDDGVRVPAEIALVHDEDGRGPALFDRRQVAPQATFVDEAAITRLVFAATKGADDPDDVH